MNINASQGALFFQKLNWDYEFDRASFKLKINKNNLKISKASFIRNNQTDISFKDINIENKILKGKGLYLHAASLGFTHPITREKLTISKELPKKFRKIFPNF